MEKMASNCLFALLGALVLSVMVAGVVRAALMRRVVASPASPRLASAAHAEHVKRYLAGRAL
jgi:hypothetical protein